MITKIVIHNTIARIFINYYILHPTLHYIVNLHCIFKLFAIVYYLFILLQSSAYFILLLLFHSILTIQNAYMKLIEFSFAKITKKSLLFQYFTIFHYFTVERRTVARNYISLINKIDGKSQS
jgi:hypothetical protein